MGITGKSRYQERLFKYASVFVRLPNAKRIERVQVLHEWVKKRSCKLKKLQSLVGKLSHECAVVPHGRTFVRPLLDLLKGQSNKRCRFIRLDKEC